jgi:hypothetical protein
MPIEIDYTYDYFLSALKYFIAKEKTMTIFALKYGYGYCHISSIRSGRTIAAEQTKRDIAAKLGYEGNNYFDFLALGRKIFEEKNSTLVNEARYAKDLGFNYQVPDWLIPYYDDLISLNKFAQKAVIVLIKGLKK